MGDVTQNFSRHEAGLSQAAAEAYGFNATAYPEEWIETRLRPLFLVLEAVRAKLGNRPVTIIEAGGYRPPAYDAERIRRGAKGVSPKSQHGEGRAADIRVQGCTPEAVQHAALTLYQVGAIQLGGLGIYDSFCHLDIRPGPLRQWDSRTRRDA